MTRRMRGIAILMAAGAAALGLAACGEQSGKALIKVDGSSTVLPIMTMASAKFKQANPGVDVPVGVSGTGGGFKKFLDAQPDLRTDISNASRPISPSEQELAQTVGVEYIELPIALDGMAVVVNPKNTFCDHLTIAELKKIWEPSSTITNWKDVRPGFPDLPLELFGPGTDSGTFDYFVEAVIGSGAKVTRSDFNASENDNTLVRGVAGNPGGLGYFGFAYFEANKDSLKLLAIDNGDGQPVKPDLEKIRNNSYRPLSRPLFIYVNKAAAVRPEVAAFVNYVLDNAATIVEHPRVGYVSLPAELYAAVRERFNNRVTGTVYPDRAAVHKPLSEVFKGSPESRPQTP